MIGMFFNPASLTGADRLWWDNWIPRAEAATSAAIDAFEDWLQQSNGLPFKYGGFVQPIWKDLKEWYRTSIFYRKCAYCESKFSRYKGDAEHYRPKSSVKIKGEDGKFAYPSCDIPDMVNGGLRRIKHPGYFWLAYDWRNLIPACTLCNSGQGKNDRFEIEGNFVVLQELTRPEFDAIPDVSKPRESRNWPGYFYPSPQMLDTIEAPLLLNPLNPIEARDPRKHLRFGVRGLVTAIDESQHGAISIEMLQLEEADLQEERQVAQEEFQDEYFDILRKSKIDTWRQVSEPLLDTYRKGTKPFSAAALDFHETIKLRFP